MKLLISFYPLSRHCLFVRSAFCTHRAFFYLLPFNSERNFTPAKDDRQYCGLRILSFGLLWWKGNGEHSKHNFTI